MTDFVTADATGAITAVNACSTALYDTIPAPPAGLSYVSIDGPPDDAVTWAAAHYVSAGAVVARATLTPSISKSTFTADGIDSCVISGLPDPCTVSISGILSVEPTVVTGATITLTADVAGDLTVSVSAPPTILPWRGVIHAV